MVACDERERHGSPRKPGDCGRWRQACRSDEKSRNRKMREEKVWNFLEINVGFTPLQKRVPIDWSLVILCAYRTNRCELHGREPTRESTRWGIGAVSQGGAWSSACLMPRSRRLCLCKRDHRCVCRLRPPYCPRGGHESAVLWRSRWFTFAVSVQPKVASSTSQLLLPCCEPMCR